MNKKIVIGIGGLLLALVMALHSSQVDFPKLTGPYLGQTPPGRVPEIFAPGIVSTSEHEYGISFSRDLKEIYLKRHKDGEGENLVFSCEDGQWQEPREVRFGEAGRFGQLFEMPDGNHLLANHITTGGDGSLLSTIVMFSRKKGVWTDPVTIGPGMRATSTENGCIYVTHVLDEKKSLGAIGRYRRVADGYDKLEILGDGVNHKDFSSAHPIVAADESYLIFDSKREGDARGGLYISFYMGGTSWSTAINLSRILNTDINANEWFATVSPDGKFLVYNVGGDIFWVSAKIIEELKPKK